MNQLPGRLPATTPPVAFGCVATLSIHRPALRTRIGGHACYARGRFSDTLTWDLDLMIQQMNH